MMGSSVVPLGRVRHARRARSLCGRQDGDALRTRTRPRNIAREDRLHRAIRSRGRAIASSDVGRKAIVPAVTLVVAEPLVAMKPPPPPPPGPCRVPGAPFAGSVIQASPPPPPRALMVKLPRPPLLATTKTLPPAPAPPPPSLSASLPSAPFTVIVPDPLNVPARIITIPPPAAPLLIVPEELLRVPAPPPPPMIIRLADALVKPAPP